MPLPMRAAENNGLADDCTVLETVIISEEALRTMYGKCHDVTIKEAVVPSITPDRVAVRLLFIYCEGLCDTPMLQKAVYPMLRDMGERCSFLSIDEIEMHKPATLEYIGKEVRIDDLNFRLFSGELLIYFQEADALYTMALANLPKRDPDEPNTEVSIRGPKDGFVEEIGKNVALIRKRIRSHRLVYEPFIIGTRSQTQIGLLYIDDMVNLDMIDEVRRRLLNLCVDSVTSANQIEHWISDHRFTLFPLFGYTGRPDFAASSLLNGRFLLLIDGAPTALIGPGNLTFLLNTSEDNHTFFLFVIFQRLIRLFSISVSIFLPGAWTALTSFHPDQLPFTLLATLVLSRHGVPLPVPLEMFIMLILFEVFKEAGMRLPIAVGQTLSVVGGLIIGQAAINAGLTASATLVISAISVISSFTLVNQNLLNMVSILRLFILMFSSLLGLFGFILSLFFILTYVVNLRTFGVPYVAPLAPASNDIGKTLVTSAWRLFRTRARILHPNDATPRKEDDK
ncbi:MULTISPECIES: spore germination protein [Geobacillus]|uniref:Spore germination protein n=1 Tax=Geobacillus jurassicus TaxID=235932 RepID=A0ABV6GU50_9BACL|nr:MULTISPECIES: spore germination protein [Geobacillus]AGE22165.1 spore germination protein [Geobacillus sp. GHH01]OQP15577.1 spore germination protein [Geobacillus zalihae]